jgi:HSP20 family molecular chaperone IbpA
MQPAFENWSDWMNRFMPFPSFFERQLSTGMIAPVDVCERDGEFIIRMACPGCRPEDLDVTVQEDTVKIRGQFMEHEMAGMGTGEQAMRAQTGGQTGGQQTTGQQTTGQGTTGQQMTRQQGTEEGTGERCLVRELPTGRFERDITLPTGVDAQRASANYEYGLLTLNVPKSKAAMGQRIQIGRGSQQGTSQNIGVTGR